MIIIVILRGFFTLKSLLAGSVSVVELSKGYYGLLCGSERPDTCAPVLLIDSLIHHCLLILADNLALHTTVKRLGPPLIVASNEPDFLSFLKLFLKRCLNQ